MRLYIEDDAGKRTMMALLFAGKSLEDADHIVEDLGLDRYNTRQEATLHVRRQLAAPRSVWLAGCAAGGGQQQHLEAVERGSTMEQMMELLTVRGLAAAAFASTCGSGNVVVRRADGSTTRLTAGSKETISELEARIQAAEGACPESLAFMQAPDGCLHVVFGPSQSSTASSFPVYCRNLLPQPVIRGRQMGPGQEPLGALARRLCVNP
ncbi:hypothetical protein MNEG_8615 [Monoraphidium neglectum]|uniref:Uncharacterized protein n=1 Tax=Monoraphidium neglectum TaxID=145388 RepID=A0A0D2JJ59_9CHLO|nr:hypothetical protein MNEG_8615 [Monoraphidium neglectum]KIY99347.1 hypothetical protein MNEG_8615 [Monoraphidium neglectum]|eukprot:XP_013898367.1 hypothetical protein MNEG_8615 [Monoraphidium neglectum]